MLLLPLPLLPFVNSKWTSKRLSSKILLFFFVILYSFWINVKVILKAYPAYKLSSFCSFPLRFGFIFNRCSLDIPAHGRWTWKVWYFYAIDFHALKEKEKASGKSLVTLINKMDSAWIIRLSYSNWWVDFSDIRRTPTWG